MSFGEISSTCFSVWSRVNVSYSDYCEDKLYVICINFICINFIVVICIKTKIILIGIYPNYVCNRELDIIGEFKFFFFNFKT